ncbi:MAG: HAD family phosphatase [Anaerolineales bacterium]|jgi:HAD superfamily hydrolase (TIGR01509 family)
MKRDFNRFAVLWDMDGVLIDTGDLHYHTWKTALEELGYSFSKDQFVATFGKNNASALEMLFGEKPTPEFTAKITDRKESLFREMIKGRARLLPGVDDWLEKFQECGVRQAIASSAPVENIDVLVDELAIRPYFDAIISGADLPGKPDPAVFLKAAGAVGVSPEYCVVIEDAVHGVEGALAAGMKCIAVTTTNTADSLKDADVVLTDLTALDEERLSAIFR